VAGSPDDGLTPPTGEFVVGRLGGKDTEHGDHGKYGEHGRYGAHREHGEHSDHGRHGEPGAHAVAMACGGLRMLDAERAELTRVYVRPAARGTGGGAAVVSALEAAARRLGARRVMLDTRLDLVEARGLYVKLGFLEIPRYGETGPYSQIWYGKELTARPA
jgi:GNAT superfamily N-acetyltransferase